MEEWMKILNVFIIFIFDGEEKGIEKEWGRGYICKYREWKFLERIKSMKEEFKEYWYIFRRFKKNLYINKL